jgi:hypothetical protein
LACRLPFQLAASLQEDVVPPPVQVWVAALLVCTAVKIAQPAAISFDDNPFMG